jgi:hypothetical protein
MQSPSGDTAVMSDECSTQTSAKSIALRTDVEIHWTWWPLRSSPVRGRGARSRVHRRPGLARAHSQPDVGAPGEKSVNGRSAAELTEIALRVDLFHERKPLDDQHVGSMTDPIRWRPCGPSAIPMKSCARSRPAGPSSPTRPAEETFATSRCIASGSGRATRVVRHLAGAARVRACAPCGGLDPKSCLSRIQHLTSLVGQADCVLRRCVLPARDALQIP